jgi:hypothetical protein
MTQTTPDHWAVTVWRNGEEVVTIEQACLSGREIGPADEDCIRIAAQHLMGFIGDSEQMTEAEKQADTTGSYDDAIGALRCKLLSDQFEIAVKALLEIKRTTQDNDGARTQQAFILARDALIEVGRNPAALKRG